MKVADMGFRLEREGNRKREKERGMKNRTERIERHER